MASLGREFLALNNNKINFQTLPYSHHKRVIIPKMPMRPVSKNFAVVLAMMSEKPKKLGHNLNTKANGFVEEMRSTAMRLHSKEQSPKEGRKAIEGPEQRHVAKWNPNLDGYLIFLVDSKLVYDTLEGIINEVDFPYPDLRNTGLERSEKLAKDLEWFKEQGHAVPTEPSNLGVTYSQYLKELSEKNHHAILCHFYNLYFGHAAGGRIMGKKVAQKILNNNDLEFYKWDDDVSQLLKNAMNTLNRLTESWTREEKNHCLEETEKALKYYGNIIRLILS